MFEVGVSSSGRAHFGFANSTHLRSGQGKVNGAVRALHGQGPGVGHCPARDGERDLEGAVQAAGGMVDGGGVRRWIEGPHIPVLVNQLVRAARPEGKVHRFGRPIRRALLPLIRADQLGDNCAGGGRTRLLRFLCGGGRVALVFWFNGALFNHLFFLEGLSTRLS